MYTCTYYAKQLHVHVCITIRFFSKFLSADFCFRLWTSPPSVCASYLCLVYIKTRNALTCFLWRSPDNVLLVTHACTADEKRRVRVERKEACMRQMAIGVCASNEERRVRGGGVDQAILLLLRQNPFSSRLLLIHHSRLCQPTQGRATRRTFHWLQVAL